MFRKNEHIPKMHVFREGIKELDLEEIKKINKGIISKARENKIYRKGTIDNLVVAGIDNNIFAIEFKKYSNNDKEGIKNDYLKLEALTDDTMHFKYKLGLFIRLGKTKEKIEIEKFINGKRIIEKKKLLI